MSAAGLVAILFTDLVGSTETAARLGDRPADELREAYFALLREGIRAHGGDEVKNLGDGLMVAFGAASDAVAAAVAMQQALARHNRRGGEPLAMRVASRLCARAEGGEILVTEMAQALAAGRGGQHFVPLGPLQLKGLPVAVPVHRVRWEAVADAAPPLPARLPVDRSVVFIGRAAEREVLETAWKQAEQGALRLVLVAGEPGIGKTCLATEAALHAHQRGGFVLLGRCDEDLAVPYQPFVDALQHLVAVCPDDVLAEALADRGGELIRLLPEVDGHRDVEHVRPPVARGQRPRSPSGRRRAESHRRPRNDGSRRGHFADIWLRRRLTAAYLCWSEAICGGEPTCTPDPVPGRRCRRPGGGHPSRPAVARRL